ncbi:hypothetical protein DFH11DRAFT_136224 [Phellopilus nigrolimitatus]|nr:hypothetical protein DFH11DRAFT_136224 [Phellopilus nigrolimitatus]
MNISSKLCVPALSKQCLTFLLTHAAGKPIKAMRIAELFEEEQLYRESSRFVQDNPGGWSESGKLGKAFSLPGFSAGFGAVGVVAPMAQALQVHRAPTHAAAGKTGGEPTLVSSVSMGHGHGFGGGVVGYGGGGGRDEDAMAMMVVLDDEKRAGTAYYETVHRPTGRAPHARDGRVEASSGRDPAGRKRKHTLVLSFSAPCPSSLPSPWGEGSLAHLGAIDLGLVAVRGRRCRAGALRCGTRASLRPRALGLALAFLAEGFYLLVFLRSINPHMQTLQHMMAHRGACATRSNT